MVQTSRYGLPFLQAGQAQKEVTHNDAIARIDTLLALAVDSRHAAVPATTLGTSWIVAAGASGAWAGHDGAVATLDETGWTFLTPPDGCVAFVRDEAVFIHYAAGQWRDAWNVPLLAAGALSIGNGATVIPAPGGGSVVDIEARAALTSLLAVLRTAGLLAAG